VTPVRILLVEDNRADAELALRELRRAGIRVEHQLVDTEPGFRGALGAFDPELILSDFSMPQFDGMLALHIAREIRPEVPFIFVSGTIGEEYAIRALKNGATDYVLKNNLVRLPAVVERALRDARERAVQAASERALAEARARLQAISESLPDVIWSVALPQERVLYVSPASDTVYGHPPQAFVADPELWKSVIHPEDRPAAEQAWRKLLAGGSYDVEYRIVRPDGTERWINDRGRLILDRDGKRLRIDGVARDITEAVQQRERLARLARIRDLLGAVGAACMRIRRRGELLQEFCRIAVERGGFTVARVLLKDGEGRLAIEAQSEAPSSAFLRIVDDYNRAPGTAGSLLAQALRQRRPVVANDLRNDERSPARAQLTREGNYSVAILPVGIDAALAGAVILRAVDTDFFDQDEVALLQELVANLELALELQTKQEKVDYLALYDALTGLPNRTLFRDRLTQALEAAHQDPHMLSLTLFDIERFKAINDTYGQAAGDAALREVARRLGEVVDDISRVARLGGNLFAVMRPRLHGASDAARMLEEKAHRVFGAPVSIGGRELRLSARAGVAVFPEDGADAATLFLNAEASLKRAKETGERYQFYAPHLNARVSEHVELEGRLRRAVEQRELFLHFQPKVDLATRRMVGLEALMRWQGPDGKPVSPARFVPVLEETGLILDAGRLAFELAAAAHRDWTRQGLNPPRVAVNVSALQMRRNGFVAEMFDAIGGGEGGVDLEITESLLMQDIDASIAKLAQLREAGVGIALDDFGTGHSSLAYLSRLPVDILKIDRGFVRGMTENAGDTSIVTAIISLAQALNLKVVAEGVETEEQARLLRLLRCDQMQGYLFSPPQPKEKVEALLRDAPA
jgi:diguanylate cyclase (GGDEF)-like protein/PAS domain S-box-containing protein